MEFFNKEDVYDNEISPLVRKLIDICKEHKIPMLCSFTYENCEEKGLGQCDTIINEKGGRHNERLQLALNEIRRSDTFITSVTISK